MRLYGKSFKTETAKGGDDSLKTNLTKDVEKLDVKYTIKSHHETYMEDLEIETKMYNEVSSYKMKQKRQKEEKRKERVKKRLQKKLADQKA